MATRNRINTKILLTLSALFLAVLGLACSFFPEEITAYLNDDPSAIHVLSLQLMSALFLGFAILNWMSKDSRVGGIYNRPIVMANVMHFSIGTIVLAKVLPNLNIYLELAIGLILAYAVFALLFVSVFLTNPIPSKNEGK